MKKVYAAALILAVFSIFVGGCDRSASKDTGRNQKEMADSNKNAAKSSAGMPVVTKKP
ncbi:MAG: hypothetical protein ACYTFY_06270 [Planctomycetota bacterium]|jgi:hypothetical protein